MTPQERILRRPRLTSQRRRAEEVNKTPTLALPPVLFSLPSLRGRIVAPETVASNSTLTTIANSSVETNSTAIESTDSSAPVEATTEELAESLSARRAQRRKTTVAEEQASLPWWKIGLAFACALTLLACAYAFLKNQTPSTAPPNGLGVTSTDDSVLPVIEPPVVPPVVAQPIPTPAPTEPPIVPDLNPAESSPSAASIASPYPTTTTPDEPRTARAPQRDAGSYPETGATPFPGTPYPATPYPTTSYPTATPPMSAEPSAAGGYPSTDPNTYLYRGAAAESNANSTNVALQGTIDTTPLR